MDKVYVISEKYEDRELRYEGILSDIKRAYIFCDRGKIGDIVAAITQKITKGLEISEVSIEVEINGKVEVYRNYRWGGILSLSAVHRYLVYCGGQRLALRVNEHYGTALEIYMENVRDTCVAIGISRRNFYLYEDEITLSQKINAAAKNSILFLPDKNSKKMLIDSVLRLIDNYRYIPLYGDNNIIEIYRGDNVAFVVDDNIMLFTYIYDRNNYQEKNQINNIKNSLDLLFKDKYNWVSDIYII